MAVLRRKDLMSLLKVSRTTVWRWERDGVLPPIRTIGPGVEGWLESDLDHYLESLPFANEAERDATDPDTANTAIRSQDHGRIDVRRRTG